MTTTIMSVPMQMQDQESQHQSLEYEETHVHSVYDSIASHFSSTRFKPWPVVDSFLKDLPCGSVGLDVGCGNGKYLGVRDDLFIVGSDRSSSLLKFASVYQPHDTVVADTLSLPHPNGQFDFVICIAVVHHLSTRERRRESVKCILETLKPPSSSSIVSTEQDLDDMPEKQDTLPRSMSNKAAQALIFVWALEQKSSRRGWDTGMDQDVMVPWVMKDDGQGGSDGVDKKQKEKKKRETKKQKMKRDQQQRQQQGNDESLRINNEDTSKEAKAQESLDVSPESKEREEEESKPHKIEAGAAAEADTQQPTTYQRYYHLYKQGELEEDVEAVGGMIVRHGYDRDNWWVVCARKH